MLSNEIQSSSKIDPVILARDSRQTLSRGMRVVTVLFLVRYKGGSQECHTYPKEENFTTNFTFDSESFDLNV